MTIIGGAHMALGLALIAVCAVSCTRDRRVPTSAPLKPPPAAERDASATAPVGSMFDAGSDASPAKPLLPAWVCGRSLPESDFPGRDHFRDLDSVARGSRSGQAQRTWSEQMAGRPPPDLLGRSLPPFVTRERAIAWTEHPRPATVDLVTARALPSDPHRWVVLVSGKAGLEGEECSLQTDLRLALVEVDPSTRAVRRIARTPAPVIARPDWGALPGELGPVQADPDDSPSTVDPCQDAGFGDQVTVTALDFARYDLAPSRRAFGLRTMSFEGYAGGGANFEVLTLLTVDGESLVPVLDVPIGSYKMLAGDWNADGTRQHETIWADLVIEVKPHADGMADLLLHSTTGRHALTFVWDADRGQYGCP